jgi:hypothetical protein
MAVVGTCRVGDQNGLYCRIVRYREFCWRDGTYACDVGVTPLALHGRMVPTMNHFPVAVGRNPGLICHRPDAVLYRRRARRGCQYIYHNLGHDNSPFLALGPVHVHVHDRHPICFARCLFLVHAHGPCRPSLIYNLCICRRLSCRTEARRVNLVARTKLSGMVIAQCRRPFLSVLEGLCRRVYAGMGVCRLLDKHLALEEDLPSWSSKRLVSRCLPEKYFFFFLPSCTRWRLWLRLRQHPRERMGYQLT